MFRSVSVFIFALIFLGMACQNKPKEPNTPPAAPNSEALATKDPHSYADPSVAVGKHLALALNVDFDNKVLSGTATWTLEKMAGATEIIFDVRDLDIQKIGLIDTDGKSTEGTFQIGTEKEIFPGSGQALKIPLEATTQKVVITYATKPGAGALQWLSAQQTTDKKQPFLFTQGQAVLTRTWVPCQDSPGIRITYEADIQVPKGLMAVMSAENPTKKSADGRYTFNMPQPIPPYLIALAVGDLSYGGIGERTGVYAEPSMINKSIYEFTDMEKMLVSAEALYGPYAWGRYDVIVLPASFPFGGMENPRLTFATPTIIAGDRSLTALIAHELAHSWSGNLVTNATWNDFWLNEGFTVYFESRIMEALYGDEYNNMLKVLGRQDLDQEVEDLGKESPDTHLRLHLQGRNPDDGMNDIAYEKGALLLRTLEAAVGREKWDGFLKRYFEENKFKTMTTDQFIQQVQDGLLTPNKVDFDLLEWIDKPGIPANGVKVSSDRFEKVDALIASLKSGANPQTLVIQTKNWSTHEWLHMIRNMPKDIDVKEMRKVDVIFGFSESGNAEILAAFFEVAIYNGYSHSILDKIESFLIRVGRRKFLTPIYKTFIARGQQAIACGIYAKARPNYHEVAVQTMDALLKCK